MSEDCERESAGGECGKLGKGETATTRTEREGETHRADRPALHLLSRARSRLKGRVDRARGDGDDADALLELLSRERAREGSDCALGCRVLEHGGGALLQVGEGGEERREEEGGEEREGDESAKATRSDRRMRRT